MRQPRANTSAIALFALLLSCCFAWPAVAGAESGGVLAPELAELASPTVRSQPLAAQAEALGFPTSGPGSLQRDGSQVAVELEFAGGAIAALPALREAGATITAASGIYQRVDAVVSPADLHALAALPGVTGVEPVRTPIVYAPETSVSQTAICEGGTVLSEGIDQLGIVSQPDKVGAREAFGTRGAGETIGVLSDSYNVATTIEGSETAIPTHAAEDIQSDNLTGAENNCSGQQMPVNVLEDGPAGSNDEGRAMLQIVHDIAPHANLAFATAFNGELSFAQNIERLAAPVAAGGAGAKVIVDDVSYFEEPMFQDGPIATAVAKVTAAGVTYLSSAGNNNLFPAGAKSGLEIASWETPEFRDTENPAFCPIPVGVAARHCLDFNPEAGEDNTFGITIEGGVPLRLAVGWAEPWYGVKADLDAYLLREVDPKEAKVAGETEVVAIDSRGNVNGKPAAFVSWQNPKPEQISPGVFAPEEVMLVINRCIGNACDPEASPTAKPRVKVILVQNGAPVIKTEYEKSEVGDVVGPTIFGHNGTAAAISVGASSFSTDGVNINEEGTPETYSSRGPETHYYAPVLSATPAAKLTTPEVVEKPDVVATDCGANDFFGQLYLGFWRFCGTSAAAPHAAGVIALMRQANPAKTPVQLRAAMTGTAKPVTGYGTNVVGKGLVQARQAVEALAPLAPFSDPPSTVIAPAPPAPPTPEVPIVNPTPAPATNPGATGGGPAPTTTIKKHPPKLVKSRVGRTKLSFKFATDQKGASFECSLDKSGWSKCGSHYNAYFLLGSHELKVRARGSDGNVDPTPAVFKFTIKLVAF